MSGVNLQPRNKDEFVDVILPLKHIIERLEAVGSLEEEDKLIFFEIEQSYVSVDLNCLS